MDDAKNKETQQELFEEFSTAPKKPERFPSVSRSQKPILFSTNTEQMLMAGILFILVLCGVFFMGVMRGKAIVDGPAVQPQTTRQQPVNMPAPETLEAPSAPVRTAQVPTAAASRPAAPKAQAIPADSSKPYTIQLVTHRKKELAEAEMNGLRAQGFYSFLIPSGVYFQVCVGQYASKDEAKKDLARFAPKFKDCFLRRR